MSLIDDFVWESWFTLVDPTSSCAVALAGIALIVQFDSTPAGCFFKNPFSHPDPAPPSPEPQSPLPPSPRPPAEGKQNAPPLPPFPPEAPVARACVNTGPSTDMTAPPENSRACGDQATCIETNIDSEQCHYRRQSGQTWLYCPVTFTYPRPGSVCALLNLPPPPPPRRGGGGSGGGNASSMYVCSSDKLGTVVEGLNGVPVPGGINQQPWQPGNTTVYTQWVRWAESDMQPRTVEWSVRSGTKACSVGSRPIQITVNGMSATCTGPRFLDPAGTMAAGCQANDGTTFNECLWSIGGNPGTRAPPLPPFNPCVLSGVSSEKTPGGTECVNQANCLDLYYDSAKCQWRIGSDGSLYLYCPVCLRYPRDSAMCPGTSSIEYLCAGDELSTVLPSDGGEPVPGGIAVQSGWGPRSNYCQWVRWQQDDFEPKAVLYSIKDGRGACVRRAGNSVNVTIQGVDAMCTAPRTNAFNAPAGCQGNDNVDNEPKVPARIKRPPPRPPAKPGRRAPNVPPSPPPQKYIPFPFCACKKRNIKNTPYRLKFASSTPLTTLSDGKPRVRHCFNIDISQCDATHSCCNMGIKKIEMFVNNNCRSSVKLALLAGQSISWAFTQDTYNGNTYTTFKLPNLMLSRADVQNGMSLCLILTDQCAPLENFCYDGKDNSCRVTFFSMDESCCPTGALSLEASVPEFETAAPPDAITFDPLGRHRH
ncbi:hypothetical protein HYH02_009507 [Chlamydomonas schloesseri]|uniref:Pherophorin domain-containing protein n=1 Tax=Chlamydomonas schloesseri TaxID=2026947 RepID=A0A835TDG2_9CHLO|nr:hypothetical protein HYH02_009507 [Chlamydomonas schloesseri]|eukprot:KAG2443093.1 hypothetical protein HYH02_009507 [Chlamydomonas schloesseri]